MRTKSLLLLTLCWAGLALPARADITYEYVTDQTSYAPTTSGPVNVNLYLQETVTGASTSLIAAEHGLYSAAVYVTQSGTVPAGATTISNIQLNSQAEPVGFTGNPSTTLDPNGQFAALAETLGNAANIVAGPSGTTAGGSVTTVNGTTTTRVFVGTLTLNTGSPLTTTTFSLLSLKNAPATIPGAGFSGNTVTYPDSYNLEAANGDPNVPTNITNGGTMTGADAFNGTNGLNAYTFSVVAPVPEPGSLALASLAASGMAVGAWRRWRNRRKAQV